MAIENLSERGSAPPPEGSDELMGLIAKGASLSEMMRLLEAGANPIEPGPSWQGSQTTPLIKAVAHNRIDLAQALIPFSEIDRQDKEGSTALMHAAELGREKMVALLLPVSDASLRDRHGDTALTIALSKDGGNSVKTIEALLPTLLPDQTDVRGNTPLMGAIRAGATPLLIHMLIDGGVDPDRVNHRGEGPLKLAISLGLPAIAQALMERMSPSSLPRALGRAIAEISGAQDGLDSVRESIRAAGLALVESRELDQCARSRPEAPAKPRL